MKNSNNNENYVPESRKSVSAVDYRLDDDQKHISSACDPAHCLCSYKGLSQILPYTSVDSEQNKDTVMGLSQLVWWHRRSFQNLNNHLL